MKKTITFMKTLLVVAGLLVGVNAWADGNKRVLDSQNYEAATASDWTCPNGNAVLKTGDATYGIYAQCYPSGSGNRSCYKSVTFGYEAGTGYATADMATAGYNIELDFVLVGGNVVERSVSQFIVPTTGPNLATNNTYSGTDYIFALTQPSLAAEGANAGKGAGSTGTAVTTWYINDLTNATSTTIELNGNTWYHLKLVVTATSVSYTITNNSTSEEVATGSKTVSALPTITGFFDLLGRGSGKLNFDNLEIYDYTAALTVSEPTFTFKKVDGANRIYTLANPEGSGTLYYTTSPAESAPEVGDAAYTSSNKTSLDVTFGTSGKYYAYVLHTNGTTASSVTELTVTAGELTLATPVFTVVGLVEAEDGFFYPQVSFSSDNSSLEGAPTATFDVTSPYTFTAKGNITVTASAEGYTSSSATYMVSKKYQLSKTIDFGALTADDFDENVWEFDTGAPRDYWTNRAAAIPADVTYYKLIDKTAETSSTALSDITISNASSHDPQVYIGYGLLTPYYQGVSGNNLNLTVNDANAMDYAVYNGWNNYGSGTFNTVQAGNANFGLYRYDTMLRTIKIYSGDYSFGIVGDLTGSWDEDAVMTQSTENKNVYTLVVDKFTATAGTTYEYKLRTDGQWGGYELPGSGNQNYYFENGGVYKLTFTANIKANTLTLAVEENPDYTLVGLADIFGTEWNKDDTNNDMVKGENGEYSKTYYNVALTAGYTIKYKVVKNHDWTANWGMPNNQDGNGEYWVENAGNYDITFYFNPTTPYAENIYVACAVIAIPSTVAKTISAAGYATICSTYALDFAGTGLTAYIAKEAEGNNVVFEPVTTIPANTGVLLKGAQNDYNISTISSSSTDVSANLFVGVLENTVVDAETAFVLMASPEVGFYKNSKAFTVGANTAYIPADVAPARSFIGFDEDSQTTGIQNLTPAKDKGVVYNLNGQRVAAPQRGLYIVGGKKVVLK